MKWTPEQIEQLRKMAFAGTANADIASVLHKSLSDIYAERSKLGITRAKVAAASGKEPISAVTQQTEKAAPEFSTEQSDYLTLLGKAVQAAGAKVRSLERSGDYIIITYCNGSKDRVCIACDSTLAVMAEVIRRLLYGRGY